MLSSIRADNLICQYLESFYDEQSDLYRYVSRRYDELIETYGIKTIQAAIEACLLHYTSEDEGVWKEAASKLSKQDIFEINTTIGFLCGIAVAELERKEKEG